MAQLTLFSEWESKENVRELRDARERMGELPCALEFRHQSWFAPDMLAKTSM